MVPLFNQCWTFQILQTGCIMCTPGTGKTLQLFLAFSKYTLEIILFNLIKKWLFFVRKLLFLFIHIFVTHFLKCIQNILKLYLVEYACWFKQLGCFKSFHVPYIPQTPSVYIWSKHESLHPPWVLCALVNFLNRFPNAFLEVKMF